MAKNDAWTFTGHVLHTHTHAELHHFCTVMNNVENV